MSRSNPKAKDGKSANHTLILMPRYLVWIISILLTLIFIVAGSVITPGWYWLCIPFALLSALGFYDVTQKKHAILRNYPVAGHIRFIMENFRPEIRQYFIEGDEQGVPYSRDKRSLVYRRAKGIKDTMAFGTLVNPADPGSEWFLHTNHGKQVEDEDFRFTVGGDRCQKPYSMSILNISAMSFGALSGNAIEALNKGAKEGGFLHDTGEGSLSPYHQKHGGDVTWELGTAYFGCRTEDGHFDPEKFAKKAVLEQVKMVEIKLSQGAKPGLGGVLPASKITPEIAETRGVPQGKDCISPGGHTAFSTPRELVHFWQSLREMSGGKPVGFKLCIGQPWEFMAIVKAMIEEDNYPDFIVIDGSEGGTGAAPVEFMDQMGMPRMDGFIFAQNVLVGAGIRDKIRLGVSGKIISGFDVAKMLALGADWCNIARGFMFSLGCIQSRACHTNKCPVGVATQDTKRQKALVVEDKAKRVASFHKHTLHSVAEIVGAVGVSHPSELTPYHIACREHDGSVKLLAENFNFLDEGDLINNRAADSVYGKMWKMANPDNFLVPVTRHNLAESNEATISGMTERV